MCGFYSDNKEWSIRTGIEFNLRVIGIYYKNEDEDKKVGLK